MKHFSLGLAIILLTTICMAGSVSTPATPSLASAEPSVPTGEPSPGAQESQATAASTQVFLPVVAATEQVSAGLVQPDDLVYLGAFRLPPPADRPLTFEYGGNAATFNPAGDPDGPSDGFPGSLFVTGHDRIVDEVPNGDQLAEVDIPVPVISENIEALNQATFLQNFQDVAVGHFAGMDEIPRVGLQYLDVPATGPKIHIAWGSHLQPETPAASHAWINPHLTAPDFTGVWFIGDQSLYSTNGYMLEIPAYWAEQNTQGRLLGTGRYRDGGVGGMGPALFAYQPWVNSSGTPAASGTHLPETTLLLYQDALTTEKIEKALENYQHPDEWEGAAFLTTSSGSSAVIFAGTKGIGAKYWYGWINPAGPDEPCVEVALVDQFPTCRLANGEVCPPEDLLGCEDYTSNRGWWSSSFQAQVIFYAPADLAKVAAGQMEPWEPQPYAVLNLDQYLFLAGPEGDAIMLGTGVQRRFRIGDVTFDREHGLLYILELFADGAAPVVHVWKVGG